MIANLVGYVVTAVVFLGLDAIWLSQMGQRLYKPVLGESMLDKPLLAPAGIFYLIYIFGVCFFAVWPAAKAGSLGKAATSAAVLALVAYATYDLTNQATLRVWSVRLTVADLAWGVFVTTLAASVGYWAMTAAASRLR